MLNGGWHYFSSFLSLAEWLHNVVLGQKQIWNDMGIFIFGWTIYIVARLLKPSWLSALISTDYLQTQVAPFTVFSQCADDVCSLRAQ